MLSGRARLPYSVMGNEIEYQLYNSTVTDKDYFLFAKSPCDTAGVWVGGCGFGWVGVGGWLWVWVGGCRWV